MKNFFMFIFISFLISCSYSYKKTLSAELEKNGTGFKKLEKVKLTHKKIALFTQDAMHKHKLETAVNNQLSNNGSKNSNLYKSSNFKQSPTMNSHINNHVDSNHSSNSRTVKKVNLINNEKMDEKQTPNSKHSQSNSIQQQEKHEKSNLKHQELSTKEGNLEIKSNVAVASTATKDNLAGDQYTSRSITKNDFYKLPASKKIRKSSNNTNRNEDSANVSDYEYSARCFLRLPKGNDMFYYDMSLIPSLETTVQGTTLHINLCDNPKVKNCSDKGNGIVLDENCKFFAGDDSKSKSWFIEGDQFALTLPKGEVCEKGAEGKEDKYYEVTAIIKCDTEAKEEPIVDRASGFDSCTPSVIIRSYVTCEGEKFTTWIENTKVKPGLVAFIFITLGLTILLFGIKIKIPFAIILFGTCSSIFLIILISPYLSIPGKFYIIVGLVLGLVILLLKDLIYFIISACFGYMIGSLVFNLMNNVVEMTHPIWYILFVAAGVAFVFYVLYQLEDTMIIITSVIFGSLLTLRGLGVLTNSFPDEAYLAALIKHREFSQFRSEINTFILINFVPLCLFIIVGFIIQNSMLKPEEKTDKPGEQKDGAVVEGNKGENKEENTQKEGEKVVENN